MNDNYHYKKPNMAVIRQNLDGWFYSKQMEVAIVGGWWEIGLILALTRQSEIDPDDPILLTDYFHFEQGNTDHMLGRTHSMNSLNEIAIYPMMGGKWKVSWMKEQGLATDTGKTLEEGWSWPIMRLAPDFYADCVRLLSIPSVGTNSAGK
jgi:hypothetical protein